MKPPSENQPQEVLAGLVGELHVPSAYGASIHKSQRSEYPAVVIPVMTQHYAMLQGNLLTASRSCGARLRTSAIGKYASFTAENVAGVLRARSSGLGRADLRHGIPLDRRRS
jgi:hypothetical protein